MMHFKRLFWIRLLFALYSLALLYLLFFYTRRSAHANVNLIPFQTLAGYIQRLKEDSINVDTVFKNVFGNLVLFLPMGFLLPFLSSKCRGFLRVLLITLSIIFVCECFQLIFSVGSFDIDDLLFNAAGCCLGYALSKLPILRRVLPEEAQR